MKESPKPVKAEKSSFKDNIKNGLKLLKHDPNIKRLIRARFLTNAFLMSSPFYIIAAIEKLGIPRSLAGTYLSFEMAGYLGANLLWARISNKISNRLLLKVVCICAAFAPALAIISLFHNPGYILYGLVFFFNGAVVSGVSMGFMNYLLEIIDEETRPLAVGLVNTLIAPTVFLSAIGGLIGQFTSLQFLFALTLICLIFAFVDITRLREPRRGMGA
jgi:MFS family permease